MEGLDLYWPVAPGVFITIPGVTKRYGTNFRTHSSHLEEEIMLYEHGSGNAVIQQHLKHASHFKMDPNTHTHTHTHTQTNIVYYYYYYYYYYYHYVFPLLNPSQLPIEVSYFNGNKAFPDPRSYNIISSYKCVECVLKFVSYLFLYTRYTVCWS